MVANVNTNKFNCNLYAVSGPMVGNFSVIYVVENKAWAAVYENNELVLRTRVMPRTIKKLDALLQDIYYTNRDWANMRPYIIKRRQYTEITNAKRSQAIIDAVQEAEAIYQAEAAKFAAECKLGWERMQNSKLLSK